MAQWRSIIGIVAVCMAVVVPPGRVAASGSDGVDAPAPRWTSPDRISAERAELLAREAGILVDPVYSGPKVFIPNLSPVHGLRFEMSFAPPASDIPTDPYEMGKYGRLTLEYNNFAIVDGSRFGIAAQALHVAHHLLLYSAGITSDINCDGMFMVTAGLAMYQTGNSRDEPFVDAPFMRVKFQSSQNMIFLYSEIEATMNSRSYLSGQAGLGLHISEGLRLIGGYQHTEFVMPTEQAVRMVNGFQGTIQLGM